jgi:JAB1/Mov34/MPN/PAD-1 ubiquitin protease
MLKHGRAGVPMEVMGLMLGEFVDEYTVQVIDVFAMPQSGTTVSVESVDHVFQTKMVDMLKQTGRCVFILGTPPWFVVPLIFLPDQKWSLAGIIHIQVLDAGFQVLMCRRNRFAFSFRTSFEV